MVCRPPLRTTLWASALIALSCFACHHKPSPFDQALARAADQARRGEISSARESYQKAHALGRDQDERVEALYRGLSLSKDASGLFRLARENPSAERAPRCLLDAGRIYRRAGRAEEALSVFRELLSSYPESASAASGLRELLRELLRRDPSGASSLAFIAKNRVRLSALDEELRYREAALLETSEPEAAIFAYEELARRYPLPEGVFADEALLRAAKLRRARGDIEGALLVLTEIEKANERSLMVGSYTRSSYAEAAYLRATILRDDKRDLRAAARAFEAYPDAFPKSRLRDDAIAAAAKIYLTLGDGARACACIHRLAEVDPKSRHRREEPLFCGRD